MSKIDSFKKLTDSMVELYKVKNENYDDAFDKSLDDDGLLVSKIRIGDKFRRFSKLVTIKSGGTIDESIKDTLIDLANYAIMTLMWIERQEIEISTPRTLDYSNPETPSTTIANTAKVGFIK